MQASNLFSPRRRKEFFAELDANARVYRAHYAIPKRYLDLVKRQNHSGRLYLLWEVHAPGQ